MRINPGLQVLSLVEGAIQIGTGQRARWITGLTEAEKRFVLSLCERGPRPVGPAPEPPAEPRRGEILQMLGPVLLESPAQPPPPRASAPGNWPGAVNGLGARLVPDALQWGAAYQMDAVPVLQRRAEAKVALYGCGRMGQLLAHVLAGAGVGSLMLCDGAPMDAGDLGAGTTGITGVGAPRARVTARALQSIHPHLVVADAAGRSPDAPALDMAVVIAGGMLPPLDSLSADAAMLPVLFTDSGMHLGPMVIDGLTMCAPCAWEQCDPTLRMLAANETAGQAPALRPEASLAAVAAGLAAMAVLMALDRINVPAAAESMVVCDLPTGSVTSVPARPRARCGCLDPLAA
ncbi:ThiF family adenylyltransferase [Paeniglutamicibacter sp. ABSL32-1]|uniref:ThiF family adenylyltransferase n=1 Tax=Paeniglutamicibacter quisquiliarum TaxID=2849498 RepID=UPI001C2D37D7|nr:ThiF family adenylyltransferase [Paeniglutamicibacter quisquiliarum]MBV1779596.1 ThiF family adenylyltransferase [Paeniglutamicibacter quisquiliarum]